MSRQWTLPGPQFPYLIIFKDDALTRGPYLRAPPLTAIQMLDSWVVTSKQALQEISGALPASAPAIKRVDTVAQLKVPAEARRRVETAYYPSGHMMYLHEESRVQQSADLAAFVRSCLPG